MPFLSLLSLGQVLYPLWRLRFMIMLASINSQKQSELRELRELVKELGTINLLTIDLPQNLRVVMKRMNSMMMLTVLMVLMVVLKMVLMVVETVEAEEAEVVETMKTVEMVALAKILPMCRAYTFPYCCATANIINLL